MKYAFIFDCDVPSGPDHYCMVSKGAEVNLVTGVSPIEDALPVAMGLAELGYTRIGFCGAFDEAFLEGIRKSVGPEVGIAAMGYFPEEMAKLEAMDSFGEYGLLIQADGLTSNARFLLENESCNAKVCFVPDWDHALEAVDALEAEGIGFIECCGWFDPDKVREIIRRTGGKFPVGSTSITQEQ